MQEQDLGAAATGVAAPGRAAPARDHKQEVQEELERELDGEGEEGDISCMAAAGAAGTHSPSPTPSAAAFGAVEPRPTGRAASTGQNSGGAPSADRPACSGLLGPDSGTPAHAAAVAAGAAAAEAAGLRGQAYVPLTNQEALAQLDPHRLWHEGQAFSRRVLAELRHQLRDGQLVQLGPGEHWQQHSHAVLLHGTLHTAGAGSSGHSSGARASASPVAAHAEQQGVEVQGPSVLPWLHTHIHASGSLPGLGLPGTPRSGSHASHHAEGMEFSAGSRGAVLVVCREAELEGPTPASSVAGASAGHLPASPFASAAGLPADQQPLAAKEEAAEEGTGGTEGPGEEAAAPRLPMHRVKSRRLALSSQLLGMETVASPGPQ